MPLIPHLDLSKEMVQGIGNKLSNSQKLVKYMYTLCEEGAEGMICDDMVEAIVDINNELVEL